MYVDAPQGRQIAWIEDTAIRNTGSSNDLAAVTQAIDELATPTERSRYVIYHAGGEVDASQAIGVPVPGLTPEQATLSKYGITTVRTGQTPIGYLYELAKNSTAMSKLTGEYARNAAANAPPPPPPSPFSGSEPPQPSNRPQRRR